MISGKIIFVINWFISKKLVSGETKKSAAIFLCVFFLQTENLNIIISHYFSIISKTSLNPIISMIIIIVIVISGRNFGWGRKLTQMVDVVYNNAILFLSICVLYPYLIEAPVTMWQALPRWRFAGKRSKIGGRWHLQSSQVGFFDIRCCN